MPTRCTSVQQGTKTHDDFEIRKKKKKERLHIMMMRISAIGCLVVATTVGARPAHRERVSPLNQQHAGNGAGVRQNGLATQQSTFEDLRLCAKKERKSSYTYKDVAGPASEFASMAQPDEASLSAYSGHFATQFTFTPAADAAAAVTFTQEIVVDSASGFAISAFTVDSKDTTFTLTAADGKEVDLTKVQSEVSQTTRVHSRGRTRCNFINSSSCTRILNLNF